jgi:hypothetical protein
LLFTTDGVRHLLPTASATAVGDVRASASGNSAPSCDRTATIHSSTAGINTRRIGSATAAILIVRITISPTIIATATGYDCSSSNDRPASIGGTTSNCTASNCTTSCCTASVGASALAPD